MPKLDITYCAVDLLGVQWVEIVVEERVLDLGLCIVRFGHRYILGDESGWNHGLRCRNSPGPVPVWKTKLLSSVLVLRFVGACEAVRDVDGNSLQFLLEQQHVRTVPDAKENIGVGAVSALEILFQSRVFCDTVPVIPRVYLDDFVV